YAFLRSVGRATSPQFQRPIKRFNPWYWKGSSETEADFKYVVDVCYTNNLVELGWEYVGITDGWQGGRTNGGLYPNPTKYPNFTNLFDYAHSRGMKVVIYTENGTV